MERNEAFVFFSLSITGQASTRKWLFTPYETRILHKTHVPVSDTDTPRIRPDMYPRRIGEIHVF